MKKCLIITPKFYSFTKYISEEFLSLDYKVEVLNDEYPANTFGKIIGTLQLPLVFKLTEKKILSVTKDNFYDIIFIIKGRGMSVSLIEKLKTKSKKIIAYTYDSFKYHPSPLKWYKSVDEFYTFDFRDADKHNLKLVELYSSIEKPNREKKNLYFLSAIFRNHSNRIKYLDKVLKTIHNDNVYIYIYEKDIFTFITNFIKQPFLYLTYLKFIHFKPLGYYQYISTLYDSEFTLDYCHPYQSGITMRCFEALCLNTKILSNNLYNYRSPYFSEDNVLLFNFQSTNTHLNNSLKALKGNSIQRNRDLKDFFKEIFGNISTGGN